MKAERNRYVAAFFFTFIATVVGGCAVEEPVVALQDPVVALQDNELQLAIAYVLSAANSPAFRDAGDTVPESANGPLEAFYRTRSYMPLWVGTGGITDRGAQLIQQLSRVGEDALDPKAYRLDSLSLAKARADAQDLAYTEITLSSALMRYAVDLRGDPSPNPGILGRAATATHFPAFLDGMIPSEPTYRKLREALRRYRTILQAGGWQQVPPGPRLEPGATGPRVGLVRQRLVATDDLSPAAAAGSNFYDGALEAAVRRFEARHGLDADGMVGDRTLDALNVSTETRVALIEQSLRDLRDPDFRIGDRGVIVNIPAAEARVIEGGRQVLKSRVIVGRPDWPTPTLQSQITAVVLNPAWTVPRKIVLQEILPKIRGQGVGYLQQRKFRVFDSESRELDVAAIDWAEIDGDRLPYILRQDPGPTNPLGRVKFLFANTYSVYLHDTPNRSLFDHENRTLSHGCIRIEGATALALHLLRNEPGWDQTTYARNLKAGKTIHVRLTDPMPVHLVSLFVWVGEMGEVQFRDDPYAPAELADATANGEPSARAANGSGNCKNG
jgi:murein L,D-transpeptidase YcbB/YkuD